MTADHSPGLIESVDLDLDVIVLVDDLLGLLVRVERVHENKWHIGVEHQVDGLQLLDGQVEKSEIVSHSDRALGSLTAHGGSQTSVELDNDELVQVFLDSCIVELSTCGVLVRHDLPEQIHSLIRLNSWTQERRCMTTYSFLWQWLDVLPLDFGSGFAQVARKEALEAGKLGLDALKRPTIIR